MIPKLADLLRRPDELFDLFGQLEAIRNLTIGYTTAAGTQRREPIPEFQAMKKIEVPVNLADMFRKPDNIRNALSVLTAVQKLTVNIGGVRSPIRISESNAVIDLVVTSSGEDTPIGPTLDPETIVWRDAVLAAGGTFAPNSISIADALIIALGATAFDFKIKYLLPLLGNDLIAARVPLRDFLGVGIAANVNFVDADFSQSTGLQGNGTSKLLNSKVQPFQLSGIGNAGLGYWEMGISYSIPTSGVEPMGTYDAGASQRFCLDLRNNRQHFLYGIPSIPSGPASAAGNGNYYGQRAAFNSRELFLDGASIGANNAADNSSGATATTVMILGCDETLAGLTYFNGRCAVAYMTDGSLTSAEVAALHTLLNTYLIGPTGRV